VVIRHRTLRARRHSRDQGRKIDHLINLQIQNETEFVRMSEEAERRSAQVDERIARLSSGVDERIARLSVEAAQRSAQVDDKVAMVAQLQAATDQRLNNLMDLLGYNSST